LQKLQWIDIVLMEANEITLGKIPGQRQCRSGLLVKSIKQYYRKSSV
jgi:hypothetical protein